MDISKTISKMKEDPQFTEHVGMILVHNGVVRGWSRGDHSAVCKMKVNSNLEKVEQIRRDIEAMEGIYKVAVEARSGIMQPGDDVLFLVVAGDIRENVKLALALMLDRVKAEAVTKEEYFEEGKA